MRASWFAQGKHMSLNAQQQYRVPKETARVAKTIFPKGNTYIQLYDALGTIYADEDFADLLSHTGQPAVGYENSSLASYSHFWPTIKSLNNRVQFQHNPVDLLCGRGFFGLREFSHSTGMSIPDGQVLSKPAF